jgi:multiple sugar transport system ATP-binding protein
MASVSIEKVEKAYGTNKVVHGINVEITDGEFCVLVGPSGCGKSTLLRMIAGLEEISGGNIKIGTRIVNDVEPKDRDVAMVFQNYALYPHMKVRENMAFSLMLAKTAKSEIDSRVNEAASILGLNDYLDRFPRQLSGGQRQRVAMGRAIVRKPQVFLFDEPLSNLDAKLRVQMRTEIKALHQRLKTTSVYVTHDQIEAMTMADKIVVMHAGIVEQIGTPLQLYDTPANIFVAGFIGSPAMNLMDAEIKNGKVMLSDGQTLAIPDGCQTSEGQKVKLGVRPEHMTIQSNDATPGSSLKASVEVIEPTGADTQLSCRVGTQPMSVVIRDRTHLVPNQSVFLGVDLPRAHLFDVTSQKSLRG